MPEGCLGAHKFVEFGRRERKSIVRSYLERLPKMPALYNRDPVEAVVREEVKTLTIGKREK